MASLDYTGIRKSLDDLYDEVNDANFDPKSINLPKSCFTQIDKLFISKTQSFREVLLGCALVRLHDKSIDLTKPYINQGDDSFNGRTLDEKVINQFFHSNEIPSSKGPYLAAFRRSVRFEPGTGAGMRDKASFDALIDCIQFLGRLKKDADVIAVIRYMLWKFVELRNSSKVTIARLQRLPLSGIRILVEELSNLRSGGLVPVLISVALFKTISETLRLNWSIEWQGINSADQASGASGDITIKKPDGASLVCEVTERPIDGSRVVSTFNTKIVKQGLPDYLFIFTDVTPTKEADQAAEKYFSRGHEIVFVKLIVWVVHNLAVLGGKGRSIFIEQLATLIDAAETPASIKVAWNKIIQGL